MSASAVAPHASFEFARAPRALLSWSIAVVGCAAAATSFTLAVAGQDVGVRVGAPLVIALLTALMTLSYVLCGLIAWRRRPNSRFGPLMIAGGFVNFVSTLGWATAGVLHTVGQALDLVPPVLFMHIFLVFPDGRLRGRFVRALVLTSYAAAIGFELVRMYFGGFGPNNLLEGNANAAAGEIVRNVQLTIVSVACLTGVAVLAVRRWRAGRPLRRSLDLLVDAFGLGLVMIAFLFLSLAFGGPWVPEIRWGTFAAVAFAPVVFLAGILQARLARSAVGDLVVELRRDLASADLRDALARTLRDPSLELAYWLPQFEAYVDVEGQPVGLDDLGRGRATTPIDREGEHIAVLVHDASLRDEPELLDAATAAAGIAVDNGRLQAELRARLDDLRGSRARVIEAGQKERKRLERDLHDGAQQRLVALSMQLRLLAPRISSDPAAAEALVVRATSELATSIHELRQLAQGIHPSVLNHGLTVALESVAGRSTVPTVLSVELAERLPETVETAAYFVVAEAMTNIAKYAQASAVNVHVSRDRDAAFVEVSDDGIGGADDARGSGLRGLADRVEALDGRLSVVSPAGRGTTITAVIPCASQL
jgi:signal transduction histidine kinase